MCGIYTKVVQNSRGQLKTIRVSKEEFDHIEEYNCNEYAEFYGDDEKNGIDYTYDKTVSAYVPTFVASMETDANLEIFGLGDATEEAREMIAS